MRRVVITGMGMVTPLGTGVDRNWAALTAGKSGLQKIWEGIVGAVLKIFENQSEDQFSIKVPLSGDLNKLNTDIVPAIWNIFSNAFVEAFSQNTNDTINFKPEEKEKQ